MKVLNLYAGIGGNRKLWTDIEVTAVENNPEIAKIYQDFFPDDTVIIDDAHQYLLDHFKEYDFIWSSPPCPTHSRMENIHWGQGYDVRYPDMTLYQEIILLQHRFKGKYCVENVISYYKPLIQPIESNSHYFWTNFYFSSLKNESRKINTGFNNFGNQRVEMLGINLDKYNVSKSLKEKMINNCVEPEVGLHILNTAIERTDTRKFTQIGLEI